MLSTDGYANSFATPADFLKVGTDYLDMLQGEGKNPLQKSLPKWLEEASREGSGDDITLGMIYRIEPPLANREIEAKSIDAKRSIDRTDQPSSPSDASDSQEPDLTSGSEGSNSERAAAGSCPSVLPDAPVMESPSALSSCSAQDTDVIERNTDQNAGDSLRPFAAPSDGSMIAFGAARSRPMSMLGGEGISRIGVALKASDSDARPVDEDPAQSVPAEARCDEPNLTESRAEQKQTDSTNNPLCLSPPTESTDREKAAPPSLSIWQGLKRLIGGSND